MTRINDCLKVTKKEGKKALIAYIVNGDPFPDATLTTMHALVAEGVDIIEVGVPFSDPMAEGLTIQLGHERSLEHNTSLTSTIDLVREFRQTNSDTPVVLMGYANPVERMGYQNFASMAGAAGLDGLLTVDLPPEESVELNACLKEVGIESVFLIAPTTTMDRAKQIAALASGFLYYVSLNGVTGAGHLDVASVTRKLSELRQITELPICVGFGIKDAESAKAVATYADGVIVGSLLVDQMGKMANCSAEQIGAAVADLIKPIRMGLDEI